MTTLTAAQVKQCRLMFADIAPQATITFKTTGTKKGYISYNPFVGVTRIMIYNAEWSTGPSFGYSDFEGKRLTHNKDVMQVVFHELGHIVQKDLGHYSNSYAFNEITTEYVSCMLRQKSFNEISSYRYMQSWMKQLKNGEYDKLAQAIKELYPAVKKHLEKWSLL